MVEIVVCSLFVGSLGLQAVVIGSWTRAQQSIKTNQDEEEDENLTQYESSENIIAPAITVRHGSR